MTLFHALLMLSALLCSIVAGFLFAFAVVVMPGLTRLSDADFIRTFRAIDGVIQRNQPWFLVVWVGSILAVVLMAALALATGRGVERPLAFVAALVYLIGVQATTFVVNTPLNNRLQALDVGSMNEDGWARARRGFESRWTRWNLVRTACALLTSSLLIVLLMYA